MFSLAVPAFGAQEMCAHFVVPPRAAILELSSHNHKRGKRFRIWEGAFSCAGGLHVGRACSPTGVEPGLGLDDPCDGSACLAPNLPRVGDCDRDERITIEETLPGVPSRSARAASTPATLRRRRRRRRPHRRASSPWTRCSTPHAIPTAARSTPAWSLDPAVVKFDPPLHLGGAFLRRGADAHVLLPYDNGATDPRR
jgi:hypothetical protein